MMTIKEQETNIDQFKSKLMELGEISLKVIGLTEMSLLKVVSIVGDLNTITTMVSASAITKKAWGDTFTIIKNKVTEVASATNTLGIKTKLATVASKAFHAAMSPVGLAVIATGVIGIGVAIAGMTKKESESIKKAKELAQACKEQNEQWSQMQKSSKDAMESSLSQIDLAKQYGKELIQLTSGCEITIENQGRINDLIGRLNELLPDLGLHFDEVSGKMVDMNGNAVELEGTLDKLFKEQEAQAYLNAYQDDYEEALKNKGKLVTEQRKLGNEISNDEKIWNDYLQASKEAIEKCGDDTKAYYAEMQKYFDQVHMTEKEIWSLPKEIESLRKAYEDNEERLNGYENTIQNFRNIQIAKYTGDWDTIQAIINGINEVELFDPKKGEEQIAILQDQRTELALFKQELEDAKNNNEEYNEDLLRIVSERLELADAEYEKAVNRLRGNFVESYEEIADDSGERFNDTLKSKIAESGGEMAEQLKTDALTGIDEINATLASAEMSALVIPVVYQYQNFGLPHRTMTIGGASYDDSMEEGSLFQAFDSGISPFMAEVRETLRSVHSRIASGIFPIPSFEAKLVGVGSKQVEISQVNNFNVPVQKPSDVSKEIARINRELAKKL